MTTYINIHGESRDAASLSVPTSRVFRDAWEFNGDAIEVDMTVAKEIHKEALRRERKPLLEALDVEFMKSIESGVATTAIVSVKEVLRSVTEDDRIEAASTPEELEALTLASLTQ